jgi:hypothetical protein
MVRRYEKMPLFRQCPGCSYDFLTGEGSRSCGWYDCPYLPEKYNVFCPACNYNFAAGEGDPWCGSFTTCDWAAEGFRHAQAAKKAFGRSR